MNPKTNMTQGKPTQLLLSFAIPLMFGNVFQQFYTVADTVIISRGIGMHALAALGCVDWLCWMLTSSIQGFSQGFSIRVSQKYGEGNLNEMKVFVGQSAVLAAILATLYLIFGQLTLTLLFKLIRVPADIYGLAEVYMRVLLMGIPAIIIYNYCSAILRAIGDSKTPLKAMVIASILNIILDFIAIFVLHLGIASAAAATVIAQFLSGIICILKIKNTDILHFGKSELKKNARIFKDLIYLGILSAAKNITIGLGGMTVQSVVNGFGTGFIAGFTATNKLFGLLEIAALSYGYAVTTYVGQNYGAKQYKRIQEGVRSAMFLATVTSVIIAASMFLSGRELTSLFISPEIPELVAEAKYISYFYLCTLSVFLPILYLLYVFLSALQGMGYTFSTFISGIIELAIRIIVSCIIGWTGFQIGIFGAEIFAWIGATTFLVLQYRKKFYSCTLEASDNVKESKAV